VIALRKLRVDFNQAVGDVVLTPLTGEVLTVGDHVAVYDLDTDTYEAVVQEVSATTAVLKLIRA
jgi:hypothetical protein